MRLLFHVVVLLTGRLSYICSELLSNSFNITNDYLNSIEDAIEQVEMILESIEMVQSLFPTTKCLIREFEICGCKEFQVRFGEETNASILLQ